MPHRWPKPSKAYIISQINVIVLIIADVISALSSDALLPTGSHWIPGVLRKPIHDLFQCVCLHFYHQGHRRTRNWPHPPSFSLCPASLSALALTTSSVNIYLLVWCFPVIYLREDFFLLLDTIFLVSGGKPVWDNWRSTNTCWMLWRLIRFDSFVLMQLVIIINPIPWFRGNFSGDACSSRQCFE